MPISQLYPENRPILSQNFSKTKKISPGLSYSRASTGTYVGSDGLIKSVVIGEPRFDHDPVTGECKGLLVEESRTNLLTYSNEFSASPWSIHGTANITPNAGLSPDGSFTATLLSGASGTSWVQNILYRNTNTTSGISTTITVSIWVKAITATTVEIGIRDPNTSGFFRTAYTISNTWQRIQRTVNVTTQGGRLTMGGADGTLLIWGAQVETGTFPTSYIPTPATFTGRPSTATFYDANGVIQTAASGVARSNAFFPDSSGVMRLAGLLLEAAGTNLVTYSEQFDNSIWLKSLISTSADNIIAPDNSLTADLLTTTNTGTRTISRENFILPAAGTYTFSVFAKSGSTQWIELRASNYDTTLSSAYFNINDGFVGNSVTSASASIQKLPNGWVRCSLTFSTTTILTGFLRILFATGDGILNITTGSTLYLWGAQVEAGSYATSYIPTIDSTVTRSADTSTSATVTRAADTFNIPYDNSSSKTFSLDVYSDSPTRTPICSLNDGTINNQSSISLLPKGAGVQLTTTKNGISEIDITKTEGYRLNSGNISVRLNDQNSAISIDGGSVVENKNFILPEANVIDFNSALFNTFTNYPYTIKKFLYYNTEISNQNLSALSKHKDLKPNLPTEGNYISLTIFIPSPNTIWTYRTNASPGPINYDIDWGDNNIELNQTSVNLEHVYQYVGLYRVIVKSNLGFPRPYYYRQQNDVQKITSVTTGSEWRFSSTGTFGGIQAFLPYASSLVYMSPLNTTGVISFSGTTTGDYGAFRGSALTVFPFIDTSSGAIFDAAWASCNQLIYFPQLNMSSATRVPSAWFGCSSLVQFPPINFPNCTSFSQTWQNCSSLTSFPFINVLAGTSFPQTWRGCTALTTFPANMFDTCTATNFSNAWNGCALTAQSIENILVSINTAGQSNGTLHVGGGTNATKTTWTTAANTAYDALIARGWTITFNA
jgi:hypothetical protein